ncbi:MAG TPA: serine hydrolase [Cyclobacteriaceae bacterium]|nr:serine hydrolase [Cyclobacteriaceae bacterium]
MKKFMFLAILFAACAPKPGPVNTEEISAFENNLTSVVSFTNDPGWNIEERMKFYGVPGASIAVIKDNKILWSKAYGIMDKETSEPVTTKTLFQAGSISKPVAAYVALKEVDNGKINLDTDVNSWLKTWKIPGNEFTAEKKVTLAHLLSHTGGLTVHGFLGYSPDLPVPTLVQVLDGAPPANSAPVRVNKTPGGNFRYSGGGYSVMQQLLIDVNDGKTFPAIAKDLVLGPLEMTSSTYDQPLDAETVKLAATGYLPNHEQTKGKRHTYPEMAAAGLWTTAEDLAKFAIEVQNAAAGKSKIISKATADRLLTAVDANYALGFGVRDRKGDVYFGHGGWDEGFSSEMVAHRDKGYGIVVLTNSNHPPFISEVIRAAAKTYNWDNYLPTYTRLPMDTTLFAKVRGRYRNGTDGRITITTEGDHLYFKYLRAGRRELFKISDSTYISNEEDAPLQFKTLTDGQIDLVIYDGGNHGGSHPMVKGNEMVPFEHLLAGDFEKALKGYQDLLKANPGDFSIAEENLNRQGYEKLGENVKLARDIFKINMLLYPLSPNVYDSYADACFEDGDKKEALINYKKSLSMDAANTHAKERIAELENVPK